VIPVEHIHRFDTHESMSIAAAEHISDIIFQSIAMRGATYIALAGGTTPKDTYTHLGDRLSAKRHQLPCDAIHFAVTDERIVPYDDRSNNSRMIALSLMRQLPETLATLHKPDTALSNPATVAADYQTVLKNIFPADQTTPVFDLIILGVGDDGHTASVFPDQLDDQNTDKWVIPVPKSISRPQHRITLTLPVINAAKHILFLISGQNKQHALNSLVSDSGTSPAALVQPGNGTVTLFLSI
jgi:6-phosphogluconolactonase